MRPVFVNGHKKPLWAQYYPPLHPGTVPPQLLRIPWVEVRMKRSRLFRQVFPGGFRVIAGQVDTGACRTILREATAKALGIKDITSGPKCPEPMFTATDQPVEGYLHPVIIEIYGRPPSELKRLCFKIDAAFSPDVKRDLFGRDWLQHVCIAMDHQATHFLA